MDGIVRLRSPIIESDHHIGSLAAPVSIVEYGDFESAECAELSRTIKKLFHHFGNALCFAFRHYPESKRHHYAGVAAVASEAAHRQGLFWPMYHGLFAQSGDLSGDKVLEVARDVEGLNMRDFLNELELGRLAREVKDDHDRAERDNVDEVPTLFINGVRFDANPTFEALKERIEEELGQLKQDFLSAV